MKRGSTHKLHHTIRPAVLDDTEAVARIYIDAWNAGCGELMSQADRTVTPDLTAHWSHDLTQPLPHRWWVAEHRGSIVGFAGIGPSRDPVDPEIGELDSIAVDPPYWRKGIGKALISLALQHLVSDGYRRGHPVDRRRLRARNLLLRGYGMEARWRNSRRRTANPLPT